LQETSFKCSSINIPFFASNHTFLSSKGLKNTDFSISFWAKAIKKGQQDTP
jgi:hypothetical protein